ncbi:MULTISPECIES: hypothetical protein [unclassified Bacillus (in: firmicutes)]|uniref:hypothetical protein n=1 Tax=unclassified Bacillus (in: firmicutes) TaxID=185979 RepID=UPI0008EAAA4F|nr:MULTISPECIES: hypothetical protein [unclassified Bacillus (in: firmicutes)]SFA81250.1 hypothetical protein SAMN02799634_1011014 [Bacillus sp. UNCCL13]SFQ71361.1 hypothetical protein SAMN04488577_1288 [Bacillus sp. cl95]
MNSPTTNSYTHKELAVQCFNRTWDFLDKDNRTLEENEQMINLAHVSFWHWTQVETHTAQNLSIGYWQLSRVYASAGLGERSLYNADQCIHISKTAKIEPFYTAYAFEARARAFLLLEKQKEAFSAINESREWSAQILIEDSKTMVLKDLNELAALLTLELR